MNQGRYVFMQLVDFLPRKNFEWLVKKYEGNKHIKRFKGEKGNRVGGKKEGRKKREEKRPQGLSLRVGCSKSINFSTRFLRRNTS